MTVTVAIVDGPVPPRHGVGRGEVAGAVVRFEGIVRGVENGAAIGALEYEVYEPMAERLLRRLADEAVTKHGLIAVRVEHSRGRVPVGACSFSLVVESKHRKEALAALDEFIDRMKADVPIWKRAVPPGAARLEPPAPAR